MSYKLTIIGYLLLPLLLLMACSDKSNKFEEREIVVAFADEILNPNDRIYALYRENIGIYERILNLPFSAEGTQSSFNWHNNHSIIDLENSGDITRFNNQIEDYEPGMIAVSEDDSLFVDEFKDKEGYFIDNEFVGDSLKGKTYIVSRPIIGKSFALIFYDLSHDVNSLSGGSLIFQFKEEKWIKVASNSFIVTR